MAKPDIFEEKNWEEMGKFKFFTGSPATTTTTTMTMTIRLAEKFKVHSSKHFESANVGALYYEPFYKTHQF